MRLHEKAALSVERPTMAYLVQQQPPSPVAPQTSPQSSPTPTAANGQTSPTPAPSSINKSEEPLSSSTPTQQQESVTPSSLH